MSQKIFPEFSEFIQFPRIVWCKICWNSLSQSVEFFIFSSVAEKDFGFNLWKTTYVVLPLAELSHVCWSHIMISAMWNFSRFPRSFDFHKKYTLWLLQHMWFNHMSHITAHVPYLVSYMYVYLSSHMCAIQYTTYQAEEEWRENGGRCRW